MLLVPRDPRGHREWEKRATMSWTKPADTDNPAVDGLRSSRSTLKVIDTALS